MKKTKVLYISQEIHPFIPSNEISDISRKLPQNTQESGKEIRVFMPRFGCINERRHQLHEVIRLSGMNLIINDQDHPLIIKVASIPSARMQVYFIDNEEYFQRKSAICDKEENFHADNDERSLFFIKGVLETVKKLGWSPDIIHCHGWMAGLLPLYLKKQYNDDPHFTDAKVVCSVYGENTDQALDSELIGKLKFEGFDDTDLQGLENPTIGEVYKKAVEFADGVVEAGENAFETVTGTVLSDLEKPTLSFEQVNENLSAYNEIYDTIMEENSVMV